MVDRIDITELAMFANHFSVPLWQRGFRLLQAVAAHGKDSYQYIIPPLVEVPAGTFLMGSVTASDPLARVDEQPQHLVMLNTYRIAIYPLTVAEYWCFMQATGYQEPASPYNDTHWDMQLAAGQDCPVVNISWHDALAYVRWLAHVTAEPYRMPTEAEWEKAARGADGRSYPWGTQGDNSYDGRHRTHTPIGHHPPATSPYGTHDMGLNICEMTSTIYQPYPYDAADGREVVDASSPRVARGGQRGSGPGYSRLAYRYVFDATEPFNAVGTRLACSV